MHLAENQVLQPNNFMCCRFLLFLTVDVQPAHSKLICKSYQVIVIVAERERILNQPSSPAAQHADQRRRCIGTHANNEGAETQAGFVWIGSPLLDTAYDEGLIYFKNTQNIEVLVFANMFVYHYETSKMRASGPWPCPYCPLHSLWTRCDKLWLQVSSKARSPWQEWSGAQAPNAMLAVPPWPTGWCRRCLCMEGWVAVPNLEYEYLPYSLAVLHRIAVLYS